MAIGPKKYFVTQAACKKIRAATANESDTGSTKFVSARTASDAARCGYRSRSFDG
jgi:hypothetical protein